MKFKAAKFVELRSSSSLEVVKFKVAKFECSSLEVAKF